MKRIKHKKKIRIKAVQDRDFKNSYWSFDILSELKKSFQEFQKQFEVKFELIGIEEWESVGHSYLKSFPFNIIQTIPKGISIEEIIDYLISVYSEKTGLPLEVSQDEKNDICKSLRKEPLKYQLGFLQGRLEYWTKECLFQDLIEKIPIDSKVDAVIAFTGKLSITLNWCGSVPINGLISNELAYALIRNFWISSVPASKVILHEIGHLFGAQDIEDTSIVSVMTQRPEVVTYDFDDVNKKIILRRIKKINGLG